jgi:hypothetical protein
MVMVGANVSMRIAGVGILDTDDDEDDGSNINNTVGPFSINAGPDGSFVSTGLDGSRRTELDGDNTIGDDVSTLLLLLVVVSVFSIVGIQVLMSSLVPSTVLSIVSSNVGAILPVV